MSLKNKWNEFKAKKGLFELSIRSLVFFGILIGLYLALMLWIRHTPFFIQYLRIDTDFYLPFFTGLRKTDFLNAAIFALIGFVLWNRDYIKNLKVFKRKWNETIIFAIISIFFIFLHYLLKYWIAINPEPAEQHLLALTIIKQVLVGLFAIFLALAVYTQGFIKKIIKDKWKSILIFLAIGIFYFFLIQFFQLIWYSLSYFVTISLRFMLGLIFDNVYFSPGNTLSGPRLGASGFNVGISNECSGVDSMLLFLSLYALLLVLDWKRLNKKKMFILLIPGIIGTVAYNILRIYLLMLVGIFIDPKFAVDVFHTNIGWMLFLIFFVVFWHFGSKWVYLKKAK